MPRSLVLGHFEFIHSIVVKALGEPFMSVRPAALIGALAGLIVCSAVLTLLWFGVSGIWTLMALM
jgi:hypothetical protein